MPPCPPDQFSLPTYRFRRLGGGSGGHLRFWVRGRPTGELIMARRRHWPREVPGRGAMLCPLPRTGAGRRGRGPLYPGGCPSCGRRNKTPKASPDRATRITRLSRETRRNASALSSFGFCYESSAVLRPRTPPSVGRSREESSGPPLRSVVSFTAATGPPLRSVDRSN